MVIRKPVAGATPLEGPGPSEASLPPEPWVGEFPLGYFGSIERPLTSEGPIQSSPVPQGSGERESAHGPTDIIYFMSREAPVCGYIAAYGAKVRGHPWG